VREFLAFHLNFFNRYRPEATMPFDAEATPWLQTRQDDPPEIEGWLGLLYKNDEASMARLVEVLMEENAPPPVHADVALPLGAIGR